MNAQLLSRIEPLETRIAPAVHTWTGAGANNLWSNAANWLGGSPAADVSNDIDLVFPTNTTQLVIQNDIAGLVVDSITFNAAGGVSANGYTINGNSLFIITGAAGQDPFGIDVNAGVADPANGITQIFNIGIIVFTNDATFRSVDPKCRVTFNGDITLGGRTLAIDNTTGGGNNAGVQGFVITGDLSNGNLVKNGSGTLQLSGDNSHTNTTLNGGFILADTDTALGETVGIITVNDPGQIQLRNGITVEKTLLNLNANGLGGGLGANGNTTNTFRGSVVLMAGAGGVALGAGIGVSNAGTRLIIDGVISGATSTLSLNGAGVIEFTRDNTYTGLTNHNGNQGFGALQIDSPGGLGAGGAGNATQLNRNGAGPTGSSLWLNFSGTLRDAGGIGEVINFAGSGVDGLGAIRVVGDNDVVLSGNMTFIAGAPWGIGVDSPGASLTTTGVIDSQGANRALTKIGAGTLVIDGTSPNSYRGTIINAGVVSVQNDSAAPLGDPANTVTINGTGTLRVEAGVTVPNSVLINPGGTLSGSGVIAAPVISTGGLVSPGAPVGRLAAAGVTLDAVSTFFTDINGLAAGAQHDQLRVNGSVTLGNARLVLSGGFAAEPGTQLMLIDNDGAGDLVDGTFAGLAEGARVAVGGRVFTISYVGGDGNDVVLTAVAALSDLVISADGRSAAFTDEDGDLVTVKVTKGELEPGDFLFGFTADNRQQLRQLTLDADDLGANISIRAKRGIAGGNGFANVGYLDATGVALGNVAIAGDLGRIDASAVKSLTVQSLGALGLTTQAAGGSLTSNLTGKLGKLTVKANIHGAKVMGTASIGPVKVLGSILGGQLSAGADLGTLSVRGDIVGNAIAPVIISGFGKANAPAKGTDLAIKSLKVNGGVEFLRVLAGYDTALVGQNADASIGAVSVGTDWRSSTVLAGVTEGADGFAGTPDDAKISGTRDNGTIFSQIASLTIKGQAFGSANAGDTFGVVAELIAKAKIGTITLKFDKGERDANDAFALAATGPGATGLGSDFFVREITI